MGQRIINNNEPMVDVRQKINDNFTEVFANNLTNEERDKLLKIDVTGDGKKVLSNDGTYVEMPTTPIAMSELVNDIGYITSADIPYIPVKTTDIINDSGFITIDDVTPLIPQDVSELNNDIGYVTIDDVTPLIPENLSELTNDTNFITLSDVTPLIPTTPVNVSDLVNDVGYITTADIPTDVSYFNNDSQYITLADLAGYLPSVLPTPVYRDEFLETDWVSDGAGGYKIVYPASMHEQSTTKYVYAFVNAQDSITTGQHEPMGYGDYVVYDNGDIELLSNFQFKGYVSITGLNIATIISGSSAISTYKSTFSSSEWISDGAGGYYIDIPASTHQQATDKYVYAFINMVDSLNSINDAMAYGDYIVSDTGDIRLLSNYQFDGYVTITSMSNSTSSPDTPDYDKAINKPILNTDNAVSLTANNNETIEGVINLHKVSKTGDYNDLVNKLNANDFMKANLTTYTEKTNPVLSDIFPINDSADSNSNKYVSLSTLKNTIVNPNDKGYFATSTDLTTAYPTGQNGWFAIVGNTNSIWIWNGTTNLWENSGISGVVTKVNGRTGDVSLTKIDVGLDNVQNIDQTNASNITSGTLDNARLDPSLRNRAVTLHQAGKIVTGASTMVVPFPFSGTITNIYTYCNTVGTTNTTIYLESQTTPSPTFYGLHTYGLNAGDKFKDIPVSIGIASWQHFRLNFGTVGADLSDVTVVLTIAT